MEVSLDLEEKYHQKLFGYEELKNKQEKDNLDVRTILFLFLRASSLFYWLKLSPRLPTLF